MDDYLSMVTNLANDDKRGIDRRQLSDAVARRGCKVAFARIISSELMDGSPHPCPRCGGQFSLFQNGTVQCSGCLSNRRTSDAIETVQHLLQLAEQEASELLLARLGESGGLYHQAASEGGYCKRGTESLLPHHVDELAKSGIPASVAEAEGIYSESRSASIARILGRDESKAKKYGSCIVYPYQDADGRIVLERLKPDRPRQSRDGKPIKYESPIGSRNFPYIPSAVRKRLTESRRIRRLVITEGEKKALSLAVHGFDAIGLAGVFNFRHGGRQNLISEIADIVSRCDEVYIAFDSDMAQKDEVAEACRILSHLVGLTGARVRVIEIPKATNGSKQGADDFLVANGAAAFQRLIEQSVEPEPPKPESISSRLKDCPPEMVASEFHESQFDQSGHSKLLFHDGDWYYHRSGCFSPMPADEIRCLLVQQLRHSYSVIRSQDVGNVLMNLQSLCVVPSSVRLPKFRHNSPLSSWLPEHVLATRSSIINLEQYRLSGGKTGIVPATAGYLCTAAVDVDFDPTAVCHQWLETVEDWFDGDDERIGLLQQWFGYQLTWDTRLQKIFFIKGPRRSGKGLTIRIIQRLLGSNSVCSPTLGSLCGPFGLEQFVGRSLAVISDSRVPKNADLIIALERLLQVSGEDSVTVNRKNKREITLKLPTRIMIATNTLPKVEDPSGALAGRLVALEMTKSYYGREDHGLYDRLCNELPGILNWAIDGWKSLREQGRFLVPASSSELAGELDRTMSPVRGFLAAECEYVTGSFLPIDDMFSQFRRWATENHVEIGGTNSASFARSLHESNPELTHKRITVNGRKRMCVLGVRFRQTTDMQDMQDRQFTNSSKANSKHEHDQLLI